MIHLYCANYISIENERARCGRLGVFVYSVKNMGLNTTTLRPSSVPVILVGKDDWYGGVLFSFGNKILK